MVEYLLFNCKTGKKTIYTATQEAVDKLARGEKLRWNLTHKDGVPLVAPFDGDEAA